MGGDNFNPNVYSKGLWNAFSPTFFNLGSQARSYSTQPNLGIPSMTGVYSGVTPYDVYGYNVPSSDTLMPTQNWWDSMSTQVKEGAWAPYQQGAQQLIEQLSSQGLAGGARSGYSGAMGAALGNYFSDASNKYATALWGMSQPGLMQAYNTNVGQNQYAANLLNQRSQQMYQNQIQENLGNYQNAMQAWQMPWNTITNYNNLAPSGAYHPEGGGTVSSIMGGLTSILAPVGMGYGMGYGQQAAK